MTFIKFKLFLSWFFLLSFCWGQFSLYAHQHKALVSVNKSNSKTYIVEKCAYCQAIHHQSNLIPSLYQFSPISGQLGSVQTVSLSLHNFSLILSEGRSPPKA